ncbi:ribosomal protein S18 acetylase RimI-like enzyme [Lederbergia galactosidilyticus]|uniref:GNAT family acetyltransferase n=1 Tax=Lederbergia galactosidilytica TaxID=217031 RepID=A0A0Q9XXW2_9BACI|nr:GNAT family N-acetyltransferase [Lederbergia galactosidilytica]KRG13627.1 GNAT family acetyltransferase [Lederbergia galactosidilytica]MBP1916072.1 ribosomal protein S18 acetylase RimI-like enzyme [Lederbergia galactosidilytica]
MIEIKSTPIQSDIRELLSFATAEKNVEREYELYMQSPVRKLYGYHLQEEVVGCIGIELFDVNRCEIKHIAVSTNHRGKGIGSKMIRFIEIKHSLSFISAETDKDAVKFYKRYGFKILSSGERYPGVERFRCVLESK